MSGVALAKITTGVVEAIRVQRLIRAVQDVDGFEMTYAEAVAVLAVVDAPIVPVSL